MSNGKIDRAVDLVRKGKVTRISEHFFTVQGEEKHDVILKDDFVSCTCYDFTTNGLSERRIKSLCKHIEAVIFFEGLCRVNNGIPPASHKRRKRGSSKKIPQVS